MIGAVAEEDHELAALAHVAPVLAGDLEGGVDGIPAAQGQADVVQVARQVLGDFGGQLDAGSVRDPEDVVAGHLLRLRHDRVEDLLPAVAHIDGPKAGEGVDVLTSMHVVHERPLRPLHDDGLESLGLGEGEPEVVAHLLLEESCVILGERPGDADRRCGSRARRA